ncbi:hypothetical protein Efla_000598 [Eimeria flavescens]
MAALPRKSKKKERWKQIGTSEDSAAVSSSPYTVGSLTSFLQQTAAAAPTGETPQNAGRKRGVRDNSNRSGRQKKHKSEEKDPTGNANLVRLRAFFDSASDHRQQQAAADKVIHVRSSDDRENSNKATPAALESAPEFAGRNQGVQSMPWQVELDVSYADSRKKRALESEEGAAAGTKGTSASRRTNAGFTALSLAPSKKDAEADEPSGAQAVEKNREEKLQRTLFVGNLPVKDHFKPTELYRHLGLTQAQIESMRLRSVPVAAQFHKCRRAAVARRQFSSACDQQNAYIVLKDKSLVPKLTKTEARHLFGPFRGRELRLDSANRRGFSLFDRKRSVCVGGLPKEATETHLKQSLSCFGIVENSRVVRDKVTRVSKGFGFVCFADRGSATKAVLAATCMVLGKAVRLMRALAEEECKTRKAEEAQKAATKGKQGWTVASSAPNFGSKGAKGAKTTRQPRGARGRKNKLRPVTDQARVLKESRGGEIIDWQLPVVVRSSTRAQTFASAD